MKKILCFFFLTPFVSTAQNKTVFAEGASPNLYISHKVAAKENFYSIGRIYNISPREIAPFNKLQLENGLSLGQTLKIPLTSSTLFQSGTADADHVFVPVYHIVKDKESLSRIAVNHNSLSLDDLKQWNKIKADAAKKGTKLIIGYLKVKKEDSYLAKNTSLAKIESKAAVTAVTEKKEQADDYSNRKKTTAEAGPPDINTETFPIVKNPDNKKEEPAKPKQDNTAAVKNEKKETTETKVPVGAAKDLKGGFFKKLFQAQTKNAAEVDADASAAVFKSTSGWVDGKYYCLFNSAAPGTIIKVTNPANDKFVYAKVLDAIPDIKQNNGLQIIISNAAADMLGVAENNFDCKLSYSK